MVAKISEFLGLILALSVASERIVEIIKGIFPSLNKEQTDEAKEGRRRAALQFLAVIAGITTALLASEYYLAATVTWPGRIWPILGLGLLASGGSGFWNAILQYVLELKNVKKAEAKQKKAQADAVSQPQGAGRMMIVLEGK